MTRKRPKNAYPEETRQAAFAIWLENGKPGVRGLAVLLKEKTGLEVDPSTIHAWQRANPDWLKAVADSERKDPVVIIAALAAAKADANQLEADHFVGIKAQLVGRLYESVKELPLSTVDEWTHGLDCLDKIEAHIHAERGKAVLEKGPNVVTSLMDRLNPNVSIAPFKKPGAAGTG